MFGPLKTNDKRQTDKEQYTQNITHTWNHYTVERTLFYRFWGWFLILTRLLYWNFGIRLMLLLVEIVHHISRSTRLRLALRTRFLIFGYSTLHLRLCILPAWSSGTTFLVFPRHIIKAKTSRIYIFVFKILSLSLNDHLYQLDTRNNLHQTGCFLLLVYK